MAKRASDEAGVDRRVIAVSRFSDPNVREALNREGVETAPCNLLDEDQVAALPDAQNVLFMTGMKFGTADNPAMTWAMNTYAPALVCRRYGESTIVAFSTGNVYGMTAVDSGGSRETDRLAPDGEYAMSALGRERTFEYFSREHHIPTAIVRLNYACELRYGVLVDIANWVWNEQPVPLATGHVNVIWQRDANAFTLRAFGHASVPPFVTNVAGPETLRVREIAGAFAERMGKPVTFDGEEANNAYLSNADAMRASFGAPAVSVEQMLDWIADWVMRGGEQLDKPTHFEVRSGSF
jgi:nucleoside-diphosphate-sugar epimerase